MNLSGIEAYDKILIEMAQFGVLFSKSLDVGFFSVRTNYGLNADFARVWTKRCPLCHENGHGFSPDCRFTPHIPLTAAQHSALSINDNPWWYTCALVVNVTVGIFVGFISESILQAINAAGTYMNNQVASWP